MVGGVFLGVKHSKNSRNSNYHDSLIQSKYGGKRNDQVKDNIYYLTKRFQLTYDICLFRSTWGNPAIPGINTRLVFLLGTSFLDFKPTLLIDIL